MPSLISAAKFQQFADILKDLTNETVGILKRNKENLPTETYHFYSYPRPGMVVFDKRDEIEWEHCAHSVLEQRSLARFDDLLNLILAEEPLKKAFMVDGAGTEIRAIGQQDWLEHHLLWLFLSCYLLKARSLRFKQKAFDQTLEIAKARINKEQQKGFVICPLTNVQIKTREIIFAPGVKIRKITAAEHEMWINHDQIPKDSHYSDLRDYQCVAEVAFEKSSSETGTVPMAERKIIESLLTSIELVMGNKVRTVFLEEREFNDFEFRSWVVEWISGTRYVGEMKIDGKRKKQILNVYKKMVAKKDVKPLQLALRRWTYSRDRNNEEDPILDYWIGLEALFNVGGGIKHNCSMRGACFLGKNAKQRKYIFEMLKKSYKLRCEVAHGDDFDARANATIIRETGIILQTAVYNFLIRPDIRSSEDLRKAVEIADIDLVEKGMKGRRLGYLL